MFASMKREIDHVYGEATPEQPNYKRARTRMQTRLAAASPDYAIPDSSLIATGSIELATNSNDTAVTTGDHAAVTSSVEVRSSTLVDKKPLAVDNPPVWSFNRGALGDSTEYMKRHEGGNHHKDGVTMGVLIDANVTQRDCIDGTVVITSVGGDKKLDEQTSQMDFSASQDESSKHWKYLSKTQQERRAVVVIIGDRNPRCPVQLPHPYCVMAHFQITDIWSEASVTSQGQRVAYWMVRFEKIPSSAPSWWADKSTDRSHTYTVGEYVCNVQGCSLCHTTSKHIYSQGWTCLNNKCAKHFCFDIAGFQPHQATYNQTFLRERSDSTPIQPLVPLVAPLPSATGLVSTGSFGFEAEFKRGIICPQCHCCSRRIHWAYWQCENPGCDFVHKVDFREYPISEITNNGHGKQKGRKASFEVDRSLLGSWNTSIAGYGVETYTLPDEDGIIIGTVTVFRATPEICSKVNGPDELFLSLQKKELKLKRNPARCKGARNEELCSHFISNWGAHYKFGVFVDTTGFDEAPEEILRGVSQLTWAQEQAINSTSQRLYEDDTRFSNESMSLKSEPFNELLSLGYFESSAISWHDDGEKELGPTVATLSLGAASVMRFRPKRKSTIGTRGNNKTGLKQPVLAFPLNHGDICIMHGTQIHKLYEHEVKPDGKLRFAMTCRFIRTETIMDPEARKDALKKGKVPEGIEHLAYRGADTDAPDDTSDDVAIAVIHEDLEVPEVVNDIIQDTAATNAAESVPNASGDLIEEIIEAASVAAAAAADAGVDYADAPGVDPLSAEDELFSRVLEFEHYIQANQDLVQRLSPHQNATLTASALRVATMANQVAVTRPNLEDD